MNTQEVKLKLITSVNRLIDTYFGSPVVTEKMINATLEPIRERRKYYDENPDVVTNILEQGTAVAKEKAKEKPEPAAT